jgi:hypothetical protein
MSRDACACLLLYVLVLEFVSFSCISLYFNIQTDVSLLLSMHAPTSITRIDKHNT